MKKTNLLLIIAFAMICFTTCKKSDDCTGFGTLSLTNKSTGTDQKIIINGVSYGVLSPGDSKDIKLTPGVYTWQLVGIAGGAGCSAATLNVSECVKYSYDCTGK
jgi:hypothetical protein